MQRKNNGSYYYNIKFKKCVIIEVRKNGLGINEVIRKYWNVTDRKKIHHYSSTVNRWLSLYDSGGFKNLMNKKNGRKPKPILLKKEHYVKPEELLKSNVQTNIDEANKVIAQLKLALLCQQTENEYLKKKFKQILINDQN